MINYVLENGLQLIRLKYGRKVTLEKCKEELQELIEALEKRDKENIHEEVADVFNILSHIYKSLGVIFGAPSGRRVNTL